MVINKHILVCDDRWAGSYSNFGDCLIYSVVDIVEMLHVRCEHEMIVENIEYKYLLDNNFYKPA